MKGYGGNMWYNTKEKNNINIEWKTVVTCYQGEIPNSRFLVWNRQIIIFIKDWYLNVILGVQPSCNLKLLCNSTTLIRTKCKILFWKSITHQLIIKNKTTKQIQKTKGKHPRVVRSPFLINKSSMHISNGFSVMTS